MPSYGSSLVLPAATVERLEVPGVAVGGYPDPTSLTAHWQLSATAVTETQSDLIDPDDWAAAAWADVSTLRTGLVDRDTGTYGLWVRVTAGDETVVRYSRKVVLT